MTTELDIKTSLTNTFKERISKIKIPRRHRMFVTVARQDLHEVLKYLHDKHGMRHVSTISAVDLDENNIEILYHLFGNGVALSLRTRIPKKSPIIDTITKIIPGALLYEREIQDLIGIVVKDIPDSRRLVLPEDWPKGVYPLRKSYEVRWKDRGKGVVVE